MIFLSWLEQTAVSVWVREAPTLWAFPFVLFLHTLGLGIVAGFSVALNIWVLRFADRYPLPPLAPLFSLAWTGFTVSLISGILLLIAFPTKALTDPVFYIKLVFIAGALVQLRQLQNYVMACGNSSSLLTISRRIRVGAGLSLALWAGAILTGRLLAYTYNYLMVTDFLMGF